MNKKLFWTGFLTGIILAGLALFVVAKKFITQPDVSLVNMKVEDLSGKEVVISQNLGKAVVINYWATWCAPCRKEFPEFEKVKKQLESKVTFLMVSDEAVGTIQGFKDQNPYSFTYLKAIKGFEGITIRPTTFIYNKKGELITKHTGEMNGKDLIEILNKL